MEVVFLFHSLTVGDDMIRNEELIDPNPLLTQLLLHYYPIYYSPTN